jgi:hypothetical protein
MDIRNLYNTLVQSLRLVASPFELQIVSLPRFVNVPDEIVLTYNDAYLIASQLKAENLISPKVLGMLKELDELFGKMSEEKYLWTVEKLKSNESWEKSRILAFDILKQLNEPYDSPNLDFINWTD